MDMSRFIAAKSDQLNADDLLGGPRTITITSVRGTDAADQPVAVSYEGDAGKPFKPCKSMRRVMVAVWGKDAAKYAGKSMTLYCDPDVQFGGMKVGGIRISHMSDLAEKRQLALTATRGKKGLHTVQPLKDAPQQQSDYSAELEQLKALARPGNIAALQSKWQDIGAPARKALGGYLDGLKAACADAPPPPADEPDDVAFDAPQSTGGYDGV
jgi:hypothetical protein